MSHRSEAILEKNFIEQLLGLGYASAKIRDGEALLANLQRQLELFNATRFTAREFDAVLNHISKGNVFDKVRLCGIVFTF